jgi:hypothetical protein
MPGMRMSEIDHVRLLALARRVHDFPTPLEKHGHVHARL